MKYSDKCMAKKQTPSIETMLPAISSIKTKYLIIISHL
jgi:hypothetical protein